MYGSLCPGTPTRMLVGLLMKLNALETMSPSAPTTTPVVGPSALRNVGPFGLVTTISVPPSVVICTTLGETFLTASFMARSSFSFRSSCGLAKPVATKSATATQSKRIISSSHQIRNPNIEIRNKSETRNPKRRRVDFDGFELWTFEFVSDFGFRVSDLLRFRLFFQFQL